ncbi:HNH endonuclease [Mycobacterium marinum]|nr:HNH endonuclease [Mycobacterium marinum]
MEPARIEHLFESLATVDPAADQAALVERIAELERVKSAAAAGQARAAAALNTARRAAESAAGVPAAQRGRGLANEIALARRDSPARGSRHLGFAKALVHEMPHTLAALECGLLSEWRATLIVRESACLDIEHRRELDAELCGDPSGLEGLGDARVAAAAKAIAYRLDPHAVVDRAAKAERERTVTIRPAPDIMTYLTALLPVAQGISVYAALRRAADTRCDGRSRGQVMADTLVERVTGRDAAVPTPIAVNLVLTDESLLGADSAPADVCGYGPIPAAVARTMVADAVADGRSRATLRRLYAHPRAGALVAMESRARLFPRGLAAFIELRDQRCRTPYCDAPIRHRDHARPWAKGGPTTADNGLGSCERCNYAKEAYGWRVETSMHETHTHTAEFTTPTGTSYRSGAPPRVQTVTASELEVRVGISLARHAA